MVAIVTRAGKGSPLTNAEVDANFVNLNNGKLETASNLSDLADASAARTNLGLGALSTLNSITSLMVTDALGYTPANKAGDTFTGDVVINTKLAVGTSVTASTNYRFGKGLTGGTSSNAFVQNGNVQSDVTTTAVSFNSQANTVAAAFTLTNYFHYYAQQGTIGVGSSVNAMTGFYADNTLAGSTNTYGFRGSVGAGSGKYNLYMDGTANNYLSGNLLIGNLGLANGKVVIGGNMTGQALMSALRAEMTIMSDVTTGARGYQTLFGTEAASWTLPDIIHYRAVQGTFGAGSTVTSQNGFVADASLIGAGTNIGFRGAIPSGSNRWNLYMDGTAQNYLGGATILNAALGLGAVGSPSYGTAGQVLTSAGPGAVPTWTSAGGASISNDTTTNSTFYPTLSNATSGTFATATTSSTKLTFNPSTGNLASTQKQIIGSVLMSAAASGTDRNLKIRSGSGASGDVGIALYDGADNWRMQLYGGSGSYGFLNGLWAGWDLRKANNSELYVTVSGTERTVIHSGNIGSQSVNYATTAGRAYPRRSDGGDLNFYWSGQSGQPTWLWGGGDGANMYVYNPSNFSVNYATTAGNGPKVWINFNGTGTIATRASYNVSSITDIGTGQYQVNFSSGLADANYTCVGMNGQNTSGGIRNRMVTESWQFRTSALARFHTGQDATTMIDADAVMVAIFR